MNSSCLPVGMFESVACEINRADLATGDVLVLYTDGITEAENSQGEEFGMERLSAVIQRDSSLSAEELMNNIFQSAQDFWENLSLGRGENNRAAFDGTFRRGHRSGTTH